MCVAVNNYLKYYQDLSANNILFRCLDWNIGHYNKWCRMNKTDE